MPVKATSWSSVRRRPRPKRVSSDSRASRCAADAHFPAPASASAFSVPMAATSASRLRRAAAASMPSNVYRRTSPSSYICGGHEYSGGGRE